MASIPTYLDRYPAKMVAHLADNLVGRYAQSATAVLDPFCGSGAILTAASKRGIEVAGVDVNPYAILLTGVKLEGFHAEKATSLCGDLVANALMWSAILPVEWSAKEYWFTSATMRKYENLRYAARKMDLISSPEGRAVLLAFALSVRRCSRADQRSPKPFISRLAIEQRKGRHFDPTREIPKLLTRICDLYGGHRVHKGCLIQSDFTSDGSVPGLGQYSHVITSPPYINAQDYYRNFKLELHLLADVIPFSATDLQEHFIGTERGNLTSGIPDDDLEYQRGLVAVLGTLETTHPRLGSVVHRYIWDMRKSLDNIKSCLQANGVVVLVCGDNLVGGHPIPTWHILNQLMEDRGFTLFDSFGDVIECRMVPPKRNGHKGLIKQEIVSAFALSAQ